jgi:hypothetical protein
VLIVPTLRVGMPSRTLCVQNDAERHALRYHAERGNYQIEISNLTPDPVGAAGAMRQPGPRFGRSGESVARGVSDTPIRCRRDLRRLPQEWRQD